MEDFQELVALQCTFDAETVRMVAALTSPLIPLLLLLGRTSWFNMVQLEDR